MNLLVIGGTGFISGRLVDFLLGDGHSVTTLTRRGGGAAHSRLTQVAGDRNDRSVLKRLTARNDFDAVFDMVAYGPEDSRVAVEAFRGRVPRFIHCSTISVYMVSAAIRCPITLDQDTLPPNGPQDRNPFGFDYGMKKRACEDVLWSAHDESNFAVSMLRPTFVSGPHDPTSRDAFWIARMMDGGPILVPGSGEHRFQQVFVDDVARLFVATLDNPVSIGRVYNVASEEVYSLNTYLHNLARLLGRDPEFVHVDHAEFDALDVSRYPGADVFPFDTRREAVFDLTDTIRDLGYRSTPFAAWMPRTIDWYRHRLPGASFGYERREREVAIAREIADRTQSDSPTTDP
jgi:nucleoside-diphosphate-sugar epimerase